MNKDENRLDKQFLAKNQLVIKLQECNLPVLKTTLTSLLIGCFGYPYLAKRYLQRYIGFEWRVLISAIAGLTTTFSLGFFVHKKCENRILQSYVERNEKELSSEDYKWELF